MAILKIANQNHFKETIRQGVTLVDFNAEWCAPCRAQTPILEKIAADFQEKAVIAETNVDDNIDSARQYGIRSIPTLILFRNGKEIHRFIGLQAEESLSQAIKQEL